MKSDVVDTERQLQNLAASAAACEGSTLKS